MKKLKAYEVVTMSQSVRLMFEIAEKYRDDTKNERRSLKELYAYCQTKYKKEKGEIFRRPEYFMKTGGDCDCQAIFIISVLLNWNIPKSSINLKVCGQKKFSHVYPIVTVVGEEIHLDMLPNRKYNEKREYKFSKIFNYFD